MKLKSNYNLENWFKLIGGSSIYAIMFMMILLGFVDYYFLPVMEGFNTMQDHLKSVYGEENYLIELSDIDIELMGDEFLEKVNKENWDSMSEDEGVEKMRDIITEVSQKPFDKVYAIIVYLFAPLLTIPLVLMFMLRVGYWCGDKTIKVLKLEPDKKLKIWREK